MARQWFSRVSVIKLGGLGGGLLVVVDSVVSSEAERLGSLLHVGSRLRLSNFASLLLIVLDLPWVISALRCLR